MSEQAAGPERNRNNNRSGVTITALIEPSFAYASFQNSISVVRSISINNSTGHNLQSCRLELQATPPFLRPKIWHIDSILAGDCCSLVDRRVSPDPTYLDSLDEAESAELSFTFYAREQKMGEQHVPIRLLARDQWGGVREMNDLLPAFVMPNDPAVAQVLRSAAEQLAAYGHSSAIDGYQSNDPQRVFLLTAAIYSAIASRGIHYAEPPASFEARGQKVRRPSTILSQRLGTCLDLSLFFASALEAAGLYSVVLLYKEHANVGVWLKKRTLARMTEPDPIEVRKALALRELVIFETTAITQRPPATLDHSRALAERMVGESESAKFAAAIDICRARGAGITPLASHTPQASDGEDDAGTSLPLPPPPDFPHLPPEEADEKPTTSAGRILRWKKKLLDLSLRNRLLNFSQTKKTVPFICTDIPHLEDRLAEGATIRLISLPDQMALAERDAELYQEAKGKDFVRTFATEALRRDELASALGSKDMEGRLVEIYRQSRNDLAEGGANTLFLAFGFLRWKRQATDDRSYRAPLLLVPVKLERRSASSSFSLKFHEDEPRFNQTLLQFLDHEFDLKLPQFQAELPHDQNGVDVPMLLHQMRQTIRDVPGMEVVDETALSTFSFAKFLMWEDLEKQTDALRQNRVVKHLIDSPDTPFSAGGTFRDGADLDRFYDPAEIVSILPADSSQLGASIAAAEGRDFVLVGPPGTGKSQTIANIVGHCLALGKTVLFVAEKTAALDVVYRRLRTHGLGDHCLELHSNKADRKSFLRQLKRSWESGVNHTVSDWVEINARLRLRRDQLNAYVDALHRRYPNGMTPYAALGIALREKGVTVPVLKWPERDTHNDAALRSLEEMAGELGRVYGAVEPSPGLQAVDADAWSATWEQNLIDAAEALRAKAEEAAPILHDFLQRIGLPARHDASLGDLESLSAFAAALAAGEGVDLRVALESEFSQMQSELKSLELAIERYLSAEASLAAQYPRAALNRLPAPDLDRQWREASASIWPMRWFAQRRVRKLLQSYTDLGEADPGNDLPQLCRMHEAQEEIAANKLARTTVGFAGVDTDLASVKHRFLLAGQLRAAMSNLGGSHAAPADIARAIAPALGGAESDPARRSAGHFLHACMAFLDAVKQFGSLAQCSPLDRSGSSSFGHASAVGNSLISARKQLRDWTLWCRRRREARSLGLTALADGLESGAVHPTGSVRAFRLAYARWWLHLVLQDDPVLREFRQFQHEHAIDDFRKLDDLVRASATQRVISGISHGLPDIQSVPRNSELGLVRHQMELQRPSRSIREMISLMPSTFLKLAPCMLMSPLSIAQYLPVSQTLFDVVIFDEASQITTWDAVGAIARGKQTIIVGDPKQLPPTNFFGRNHNSDDEDTEEHEQDLESILDEVRASGIPLRDLRWHYRSRNESLIAFSNHHYYDNRLITFPSPSADDRAVQLRHISSSVYDRGKSHTNRMEAEALVSEASDRLRDWLALPEEIRPTLGVITFNAQQQSLIQDLLDDVRRKEPQLEWFFSEERIEPVIVKNLENVQGDERDVILFSLTFGRDAAGKFSMNFGAVNRLGGERRLNVAVTRARQELVVFSGFTADEIDLNRTGSVGVKHLKAFVDFADRGAVALSSQDEGSVGGFESLFEKAVAAELQRHGWQVVPQVGISGFRIDLGICHPELPGAYLAGVECDGATYHSSATARDRDKVREQVLRGLGWEIVRVWSTDWWFNSQTAMARLHAKLNELLAASREKGRLAVASKAKQSTEGKLAYETTPRLTPFSASVEEEIATVFDSAAKGEDPTAAEEEVDEGVGAVQIRSAPSAAPPAGAICYRLTDLSHFAADPDRFYEPQYNATLASMIAAILRTESPIREDILCQRIARAHGWLRTGARIRERILALLDDAERVAESSGVFLWRKGSVAAVIPYREPADSGSRRSILELALAELAGGIRSNRDLAASPDPELALARFIGVDRLSATSRARLTEAFQRANAPVDGG